MTGSSTQGIRTFLHPVSDLATAKAVYAARIAKAQDSYNHRLGWKLLRGDIPGDKELHHRCGVYACWNPDHLELVSHAEPIAPATRCPVTICGQPAHVPGSATPAGTASAESP
jgi:hypothetical protein